MSRWGQGSVICWASVLVVMPVRLNAAAPASAPSATTRLTSAATATSAPVSAPSSRPFSLGLLPVSASGSDERNAKFRGLVESGLDLV